MDKIAQNASTVYEKNSTYINQQLEFGREYHAKNMEAFKAARDQYLNRVNDTVDFLKQNGLSGAAQKAADEVSAAVAEARKLPGAVIKQVHDAFERLMSLMPVQKIMNSTRPAIDAAYVKYESVHDTVVSSAYYKKAYTTAESFIDRAQGTMLYQKAKENIWNPYLSKYGDPALGQLTSHPYYHSLVAQIAPKA